jgi:hypothetical protein
VLDLKDLCGLSIQQFGYIKNVGKLGYAPLQRSVFSRDENAKLDFVNIAAAHLL